MDNFLLAVRDINHIYIVVEVKKGMRINDNIYRRKQAICIQCHALFMWIKNPIFYHR